MKIKKCLLMSVAPVAVAFPLTVHADTLDSNPFIETSGGGFIYVDTTEGVEPPGIKAVTFTSTRNPEGEEPAFVEPYDNFVTDFSAIKSRGEARSAMILPRMRPRSWTPRRCSRMLAKTVALSLSSPMACCRVPISSVSMRGKAIQSASRLAPMAVMV